MRLDAFLPDASRTGGVEDPTVGSVSHPVDRLAEHRLELSRLRRPNPLEAHVKELPLQACGSSGSTSGAGSSCISASLSCPASGSATMGPAGGEGRNFDIASNFFHWVHSAPSNSAVSGWRLV